MHVQMKTVTNFRFVDCMLKITAEYDSASKTDDFKQQNITSISRKKERMITNADKTLITVHRICFP